MIMSTKQSGFSLMELMITIAIIGILAGLTAPAVIAWRERSRFVGTIQNLTGDLQRGKLVAIRENGLVGVELNEADYTVFLNLDADTSYTAGDQVIAAEQLSPGYTLSPFPVSFWFNGRGTVPSIPNETTVQLNTNSGRTGFIRVNMLGRISHTFQ